MRPFTVGIIGCGWAGARHARAFANQGVAIAWAVDLHAARAQAVANLQAGARASVDYREALDDPDLDAVDICLPHHLHARVSIEAIARGKHVLCEKPLAATLQEADGMITAAKKACVTLMVAENEVFSPLYRRVPRLDRRRRDRQAGARADDAGLFPRGVVQEGTAVVPRRTGCGRRDDDVRRRARLREAADDHRRGHRRLCPSGAAAVRRHAGRRHERGDAALRQWGGRTYGAEFSDEECADQVWSGGAFAAH